MIILEMPLYGEEVTMDEFREGDKTPAASNCSQGSEPLAVLAVIQQYRAKRSGQSVVVQNQ